MYLSNWINVFVKNTQYEFFWYKLKTLFVKSQNVFVKIHFCDFNRDANSALVEEADPQGTQTITICAALIRPIQLQRLQCVEQTWYNPDISGVQIYYVLYSGVQIWCKINPIQRLQCRTNVVQTWCNFAAVRGANLVQKSALA